MKILILGSSGMIGSTMHRILTGNSNWDVVGSVRASTKTENHDRDGRRWVCGVDLANQDHLSRLFRETRPDIVINCAGLTKHLQGGNDPVPALIMNALLPHRLAELCSISGARLLHVSTDCVFSGKNGNYSEDDLSDAIDVYGKTKHLGEVGGVGIITLRTSTIGHELGTQFGLLEWFLTQERCKGYRNAIFSGLTSVEFARVVRDFVIPNPTLEGLYHVGAEAINKDALLRLIAKLYNKDIEIETDHQVLIDRSLDSQRFANATGYCAPSWSEMIMTMYQDHI